MRFRNSLILPNTLRNFQFFSTPLEIPVDEVHWQETPFGNLSTSPRKFPSIDNSHYRLILKLGKEMQINHHS
jgi:hypothetical protein